MIFPTDEQDKLDKLNQLISDFTSFNVKFRFQDRHGKKLCTIVDNVSSKLVGCDTRIQLSKTSGWRQDGLVLTREGLKELFGDGGLKARTPYGTTYYKSYASNEELMCNLIKLTRHPEIQKPDALRKLISFLLEAKDLKEQDKYHSHKIIKPLQLQPQIDKGLDGIPFSCIEVGIQDTYGGTGIFFGDSEKPNKKKQYSSHENSTQYDIVAQILGRLYLADYLQYSEEPVYSLIVSYLEENIKKCEEFLKKGDDVYQAIFEKYGEYLVISEL